MVLGGRLISGHVRSVTTDGMVKVVLKYNNTITVPSSGCAFTIGQAVYLVTDIRQRYFYGAVDKEWANLQILLNQGEDIMAHWPHYEPFDPDDGDWLPEPDWEAEEEFSLIMSQLNQPFIEEVMFDGGPEEIQEE